MRPLALAAAIFTLALQPTTASWQQVFRATGDLVYVDVTVLDRGTPVTGLGVSDFRLVDEGVAQRIELVTAAPAALDVTLLLDDSYSIDHETTRRQTHGPAGAWVAAAARAATTLLQEDDRLRVVRFASAIREMGTIGSSLAPPAYDATTHLSYGTSLFDAIISTAVEPTPPDRRHIIIALTDGFDTTSVVGDDVRNRILDRSPAAVHIITAGPADFYTMRPDDLDPTVALQRDRRGWTMLQPPSAAELRAKNFRDLGWYWPGFGGYSWILEDLTARTGGRLYESRSSEDFIDALRTSLALTRTRYLLAYQPAGVEGAGWHEIEVSVPRNRSYQVLARRGYVGR